MKSPRKIGTAMIVAGALALPTLAFAETPPTGTDKAEHAEHKAKKEHKQADKSEKKAAKHSSAKGSSSDKPMH